MALPLARGRLGGPDRRLPAHGAARRAGGATFPQQRHPPARRARDAHHGWERGPCRRHPGGSRAAWDGAHQPSGDISHEGGGAGPARRQAGDAADARVHSMRGGAVAPRRGRAQASGQARPPGGGGSGSRPHPSRTGLRCRRVLSSPAGCSASALTLCDRATKKGSGESPDPLNGLVAGAGFEPATFGL